MLNNTYSDRLSFLSERLFFQEHAMGIVRIFGLALSCVGIVLLICGYNATVAEGDVIVNRFTELFSDSTMWYITGCIAIAGGLGRADCDQCRPRVRGRHRRGAVRAVQRGRVRRVRAGRRDSGLSRGHREAAPPASGSANRANACRLARLSPFLARQAHSRRMAEAKPSSSAVSKFSSA